jgi:hypothetical protein
MNLVGMDLGQGYKRLVFETQSREESGPIFIDVIRRVPIQMAEIERALRWRAHTTQPSGESLAQIRYVLEWQAAEDWHSTFIEPSKIC